LINVVNVVERTEDAGEADDEEGNTMSNATVEVPAGLKGVVVADTAIGDVRGDEGFYHYRQYDATELARTRRFTDVWALVVDGALPPAGDAGFATEVAELRPLPPGVLEGLAAVAPRLGPLDALKTGLALVAEADGFAPALDTDPVALRRQGLRLAAVTPVILAAHHRLQRGEAVIAPDPRRTAAEDYLVMLGLQPGSQEARAVETYLVSTIDHGFNASTFTARVIASTGADLASCVIGAIGAMSGPLHGGAPSRAVAMVQDIARSTSVEAWLAPRLDRGERIMGFGHAVYQGEDPRSRLLRDVAEELGGDLVTDAMAIEAKILEVLAAARPGRRLGTNVEFYAGVVMERCGLPRELFTPTFTVARTVGWTAHAVEQVATRRLIRPGARYVGPTPPVPVPAG
jgi:citrate synthase